MSDATATDTSTTEPERGYVVDPNYVPRPTDRVGSFRNDTVGQDHGIKNLAAAFHVADRRSILTAAKALDPNDPSVPASQVNLHVGLDQALSGMSLEAVKERIDNKLHQIEGAITDEDHRVVSEVRGFFKKGEDGGAGVEVAQPTTIVASDPGSGAGSGDGTQDAPGGLGPNPSA
jgi:hypothetical protein